MEQRPARHGGNDVGEELVVAHGATSAADFGDHRVYIDHAGHPFCLYLAESLSRSSPLPGRLARIVFDCFSPRALAWFYEGVLGMTDRVVDTPDRVVIAKPEPAPRLPMLGFEHAEVPAVRARPEYPAQLHLDLLFDDRDAARDLAERLGAIRLEEARGGCFTYADPASHPFDRCTMSGCHVGFMMSKRFSDASPP